jgi:hypothetical protein
MSLFKVEIKMQNENRNRNHIEVDFYDLFNFVFNISNI